MWRIKDLQLCAVLIILSLGIVFCDSDDFDSKFESNYNAVRTTTISIATIIGIVVGLIFLVIVISIFVVCCCCMKRRTSAGQVYRQPANQMIITTGTQQSYPNQYPPHPNQYPPQQPYTQYPTAQNQYPSQGYVQHPPPVHGGYSPVQQAPPMTGSGYPPQESKAEPSAPPPDEGYPPYPTNPQQPPPYPGN